MTIGDYEGLPLQKYPIELSTDWYGDKVSSPPSLTLSLHQDHLIFSSTVDKNLRFHPWSQPGSFVEGLWEHDVAELFICDQLSGRYLEINLDYHGAWWVCLFDGYRSPSVMQPNWTGITTQAWMTDSRYHAEICLPIRLLEPVGIFSLDQLIRNGTVNITAVLIDENGNPRFLSTAPLGGTEPDFHRTEDFLLICPRALNLS